MGWLSTLLSLSKILHGIEVIWNKTVDYLEDKKLIELGVLREKRETAIQKSIQEKKARDARANTDLSDDSLLTPRKRKGRNS